MDYNDFENILNAYFFKDMLQNMLQNHFFLENVNTFLEACCAGYTLYILYIIQYTYLWTISVNQFMKTMLIQQSVGLHFKEKEIETYEKSWNALICIKSARQLLLAQLKQDNDYHGISLLILWPLKLTLAASSSVSWKLVDSLKRCTWQRKAKLSTDNESNPVHC